MVAIIDRLMGKTPEARSADRRPDRALRPLVDPSARALMAERRGGTCLLTRTWRNWRRKRKPRKEGSAPRAVARPSAGQADWKRRPAATRPRTFAAVQTAAALPPKPAAPPKGRRCTASRSQAGAASAARASARQAACCRVALRATPRPRRSPRRQQAGPGSRSARCQCRQSRRRRRRLRRPSLTRKSLPPTARTQGPTPTARNQTGAGRGGSGGNAGHP